MILAVIATMFGIGLLLSLIGATVGMIRGIYDRVGDCICSVGLAFMLVAVFTLIVAGIVTLWVVQPWR